MEKLEQEQEAPTFQVQNQGYMPISKVRNQTAAQIQITAEQLIRESQAYKMDEVKHPKLRLTDPEEIADYKERTRRGYEDSLRRQKHHMGTWIKYAEWEANIGEVQRARSVFERAIDIDYTHVTLWLKYAEMEMQGKFINHARNVWERACKYLPRVD